MKNKLFWHLGAVLFGCVQALAPASAQDFPNRMVRLVVPYPAGGGVDGLARPLAERLGKKWGQSVIIENKAGASTMIGGNDVARSPADGHTLLFTSDSSITSNPHLFKKMMFDPIADLAPVTQLIDLHQMVVVHPSVAANSMKELVALAKANPGKLNYGSYGNGSQPHLLFGMLNKTAGIEIVQVPHRGLAPALVSTIAGNVQMTLGGAATSGQYIANGQLKALAIGRKERLASHPSVPTLAEAGFPETDPRSWFGLFAPAGTPRDITDRIQKDVAEILKDPDFNARYVEGMGYTSIGSTPDEFAAFIKDDLEYKGRMIAAAGAAVE
jgi:tripartite-type tricarboxylate transporter receptor subunit TctC